MRLSFLLCFIPWIIVTGMKARITDPTLNRQQEIMNQQPVYSKKDSAKISYLSISGCLGAYNLHYGLRSAGNHKGQTGYGVEVKYQYFFSSSWGITTGIGFSRYGAVSRIRGSMEDNSYLSLGNLTDDDEEGRPREYNLRVRFTNLHEKQTAYMIEIPLAGSFQTYFGNEEKWGIYATAGIKMQIPLKAKFRIEDGETSQLNVSGFYPDIPADKGSPSEPPVPQHGFGTITNPNQSLHWDDDTKLNISFAAIGEAGFLYKLSRKTDMMLGAYIDYGFNNIKKYKHQNIFTAPTVYHPGADNLVGYGLTYNGILNSTLAKNIKLRSFGGKITLRFQL